MIKPTIGRAVWYYLGEKTHEAAPWAGVICNIFTDNDISVAGFDRSGEPFNDSSVTLIQDDSGYKNPKGESWACYAPAPGYEV